MLHLHINSESELLLHLSLGRITFLSCQEKIFLSKNIDSAYNLALLSIEELENLINRSFSSKVKWNGKENLRMAEVSLYYCKTLGIQILLYSDIEYPELLRQISDPPFLLFCRGNINLLSEKSVSVVGTRRITQNGKTASKKFAYDAAVNGCNVISGLANGADGYAHQGAVDAYFDFVAQKKDLSLLGKTIAVLPSAIDEIVPAGHKKLAAQILQSGGLIISEYEPKMTIANWHFVGRNRIIAGLSPATVVVEAPAGSGALITADFALENGRDVMFHQVCFGEYAKQISGIVKNELTRDHAIGKASKYKMENTPEKFLEAGAPVIKDYSDYCIALEEAPGKRVKIPVQGEFKFD